MDRHRQGNYLSLLVFFPNKESSLEIGKVKVKLFLLLSTTPSRRMGEWMYRSMFYYNWATLFLGKINTGTWPSWLGRSQK
jgi:hypothetical protein